MKILGLKIVMCLMLDIVMWLLLNPKYNQFHGKNFTQTVLYRKLTLLVTGTINCEKIFNFFLFCTASLQSTPNGAISKCEGRGDGRRE
jgi:hypothetical protein